MRPDLDSVPERKDLTGALDDDGQLRLCVARLGQALAGLLGTAPGPALAVKLRELADLARGVGDLCESRAALVDYIEGGAGE